MSQNKEAKLMFPANLYAMCRGLELGVTVVVCSTENTYMLKCTGIEKNSKVRGREARTIIIDDVVGG